MVAPSAPSIDAEEIERFTLEVWLVVIAAFFTPRAASTDAELVDRLLEVALTAARAPSTLEDEFETDRDAA